MSNDNETTSKLERDKLMACQANQKPAAQVELKVNGAKIELNNFVENFISQTVVGMICSLQGVSDIEAIDLKISKAHFNLKRNA